MRHEATGCHCRYNQQQHDQKMREPMEHGGLLRQAVLILQARLPMYRNR